MLRVRYGVMALAMAGGFAVSAMADIVTVKSKDKSTILVGELVAFDDTNYTLDTQFGQVIVARNSVNCEGDACPKPIINSDILITGSDTVGEDLMPLLIEGYAETVAAQVANRADVGNDTIALDIRDEQGLGDTLFKVAVQAKGSNTGFNALIGKQNNIAMSSRPAKAKEIRAIRDQGRGNLLDLQQEYIVAVDSIVVVVAPENPIKSLTVDQLADVYSGQLGNWSQVGGPDLPITIYTRDTSSGTYGVFTNAILGPKGYEMSGNVVVVDSNKEMADRVTADPGAIGYVGFASIRGAKPIDLATSCGLPMRATTFGAKTEEYVLQRRLRLFVDNEQQPDHVKEILAYAVSSDADAIVRKSGFIDLGVETDSDGVQRQRLLDAAQEANDAFALSVLRDMLLELDGASRLSTTFRFALGSNRLDNKAERDFERIVDFLQRPENIGREVMLIGYTDSDGSFSANVNLSRDRASAVLNRLRRELGPDALQNVRLKATGYGELSPVGCNEFADGRRRNRRVEVWIR